MDAATIVGRDARSVQYMETSAGLEWARWDQDDMPDLGEVVDVEHDGRHVGRVMITERRWIPDNGPWPTHWRATAERTEG